MAIRIGVLISIALVALITSPLFAAQLGEVRSIEDELTVPGWWVIGPFMSGVREAGTSALADDRDAQGFQTPLIQPSFPSVLVPGGSARWRYYEVDKNHTLTVDYPGVPEESMELVTDEWGFAGGLTVGYAYSTIHIEDGPRRALMDLQHASSVSINGVPWPGDPYGHRMGLTPVLLDDGDNELKVTIGSRQRFSLKFLPVEDDLIAFTQSATLPDVVRGEELPGRIGLPVANTTTEWLSLEDVQVTPTELFGPLTDVSTPSMRIPPLCVVNLSLFVNQDGNLLPVDYDGEELPITIHLQHNSGECKAEVTLRVRDPEQSRKVTFISDTDESVQYYGLLPPSDFDPDRKYGLILSLHGAGVKASGQADAYQPKDWAYVVAPTNRRRFGFDWQDWGQQDMLEVLSDVRTNQRIDANRIHLTGHSMGGHGTWLNALTFPGLWASAAPSAGWTRFDLYVPMFLRKNLLYGEPRANYIWQLAMRRDDTLALAENALNLPIYAMEGGADDNVPPQQPRLLVAQLKRLGYDITYEEVPGMGHWWNDPDTPGTDCVDSAALNEFWESHVRDPWPKEVVFKKSNHGTNDEAYWLTLYTPENAVADMVVRARIIDRCTVDIETSNVASLILDLSAELVDQGMVNIRIDGQMLEMETPDPDTLAGTIHLIKRDGTWLRTHFIEKEFDRVTSISFARIGQDGNPWKQVMQKPFVVVYGTQGNQEETDWNLQMARLYAYQWWYRANGMLRVVSDAEYMATSPYDNVIAVGGIETNKVVAAAIGDLPITPKVDGITAGDRFIKGRGLTYKCVFPFIAIPQWDEGPDKRMPDLRLMLVEGGTSLTAMKRLPSMMGIYSGAGFPDWMVWDDEVKLKGMGGVVAMGFFDLDWQIDPELSYFNEDLINRLKRDE